MHKFLALGAAFALTTGCATGRIPGASGALWQDVSIPSDGISANITATTKARTGRATCTSYAGVVAIGDCSVEAAMADGGLTRIHHIDYNMTSVLGIIVETTTVVYGE